MKTLQHAGLFLLSLLWGQTAVASCYPMPIPPLFFCVLDREGTGTASAPDYYTCHEDFNFETAGGKPYFKIRFNGHCGIHPGGGLPGWTPVPWKQVTVQGEYNYDTGIAEERIWQANQVMLESELICNSNPWANTPDCSIQGNLINNTEAQYNGLLPVSAYRMPYSLRQSLAQWEQPGNEEDLSDWNPYSTSEAGGFDISNPAQYEVIAENAAHFQLTVDSQPGVTTPQNLQLQWEKIILAPEVVGDIALPDSATHWWEPFFAPKFAPWSALPLNVAVNPGHFENKPGLYQIKIRDADGGNWSQPRRFWIGDPSFDPPADLLIKIDKRLSIVSNKSTAKSSSGRVGTTTMKENTRKRKISSPVMVVIKRPQLKVTATTWDEARARPGRPLDLTVTVENSGNAESQANKFELFFACTPSTDCPKTRAVKIPASIEPGKSYTFTVPNAIQPNQMNTRFFVSTEPLNLASRQRLLRKSPQ